MIITAEHVPNFCDNCQALKPSTIYDDGDAIECEACGLTRYLKLKGLEVREAICSECAEVIPYTGAAFAAHMSLCPLGEFQIHKPELLQHIVNMTTTLEDVAN